MVKGKVCFMGYYRMVEYDNVHKSNVREVYNTLPILFFIIYVKYEDGYKRKLISYKNLSTPSSNKGVLKYMSEAIISRRKGGGGGGTPILHTDYVFVNQTYTVPNHIGNVDVRVFGGGGGGCCMLTAGSGTRSESVV